MKHTHLGVYGLIVQQGKCLLIQKARGPYIHRLDLPGGGPEFGETPEQALKREIKEETGQRVREATLLFCDSVRFQHRATSDNSVETLHHIGIVYCATIEEGDSIKTGPDGLDSKGALWFDYKADDIERLTPFAQKAVEMLRTL